MTRTSEAASQPAAKAPLVDEKALFLLAASAEPSSARRQARIYFLEEYGTAVRSEGEPWSLEQRPQPGGVNAVQNILDEPIPRNPRPATEAEEEDLARAGYTFISPLWFARFREDCGLYGTATEGPPPPQEFCPETGAPIESDFPYIARVMHVDIIHRR